MSKGYKERFNKYKWFLPAIIVLALDQITKAIVVSKIKLYNTVNVIGDFLVFQHIRNRGAGFGLGGNLKSVPRFLVLYFIPIILIFGIIYVFANAEKYNIKTKLEKLSLSLIIAGGVGNMIDRIVRREGVVDFINVKVYGFLGFDYWPTFNIADASVVVGIILLFIFSLIVNPMRERSKKQ